MTSTALTPSQFIALEKQAGFPQSQLAFGLATAEVESGLDPSARNPSGATGLFQILSSHLGEPGIIGPLTDPKKNVEDAFVLFKQSGWEPWQCKGCEPSGAAQSKLSWAQGQVKSFLKNGATGDSPPPSSGTASNWMMYSVIGGAVLLILLLLKK